jgi:hypothetical protein
MFKVHWNSSHPEYKGQWLHLTKHDPRVPHYQKWIHTLCRRKVPPHCWIEGEKPPSIHWEHDNIKRPTCPECTRRLSEPNQMLQLTTKAEQQIRLMHRCLNGEVSHPKVEISTARNGCKTAIATIDGVEKPVMLLAQNMNTRSVYAQAAKGWDAHRLAHEHRGQCCIPRSHCVGRR